MNRTTTIFISIIIILLSALVVSASDENLIFLKSGNIDTDHPPEKNVSEQDQVKVSSTFELEDGSETYYIVQFDEHVSQQWKTEVQDTGAEFFDYIPNNAFVLRMNGTEKSLVESLDFVRWTGEFLPDYKYTDETMCTSDASLLDDDINASEMILFIFDPTESSAIKSNIENLGGAVVEASDRILRIQIPVGNIEDLAFISGVCWIDKFEEPSVLNDVAAGITNINTVHTTLGLNGSGQIVAVCDTGLDTGINDNSMHADIRGRILSIADFSGDGAQDITGHGTHVTGSVLGNGAMSDGQYTGMAPEATLVFQAVGTDDWGLGGIPGSNISILFQNAYSAGARIHTNSWGWDSDGEYNSYAYSVDHFLWNHPDMLILFSAGNEGQDTNYDGVVDQDSLNSPATAKNSITVGASENERGDTFYSGSYSTWGARWPSLFVRTPLKDDYMADDSKGIAAFSSRGPTDDGRIKPDIVAPGTFIISTRSTQGWYDWGTVNDDYAYSGGTSISTPIVAGSAALVREYYTELENVANPSAALMKATLLNGAYDMAPGQYGEGTTQEISGRPDYSQGWGRLDVENSILVAYPEVISYYDSISINNGDSWSSTYDYVKSGQPVRATLVWTDYPSLPYEAKTLVNDLDLTITDSSDTYYGNNGPDHINNVEGIELNAAAEGDYTITIDGHSIIYGPQPFALVLSFTCDNNEFPANGSYADSSTTTVSTDVVHPGGVNQSSIKMEIDGSPVAYTAVSITDGYSIQYDTPNPFQNMEHNVKVTAFTDTEQEFSYEWKFIVDAQISNHAPVLDHIGNQGINESKNLLINLSAIDDDDDTLIFDTNASFGSLENGIFTWTPDYNDSGVYYVEFNVTDGNEVDNETISITVENVDRAPELTTIDNKTADENEPLSFTISANDPDGDAVTYSTIGLPSGANFNSGTGEFNWTPDYEDSGNYNVEFIATANSLTDSENITIVVENVDRKPEFATINNKEVNENELITFTISATDPDGDSVTYSATTLPKGANLDSSTGEFSWTPGYNGEGSYDVEFIAESNSLSNFETIIITVKNVDRAPELATIGNKTVNENELLSFTISATDPDDDKVSYSTTDLPAGANLDSGTGEFSWTPGYNDEGSYNVEIIATANSLIDSEIITIIVDNVDRAPKLNSIGNKTINENELLGFTVSAIDLDGNKVSYYTTALPAGANLDSSTGEFRWTPTYSQSGNYYVEFIAEANGLDDAETITISVENVNRAPELAAIGDKSVLKDNLLSITLSGNDDDGDSLTYSTNATFGTLTDNLFEWTPGFSDAGSYDIEFSVTDGIATDSEVITITVTDVNRAPVLAAIGYKTVLEDTLLSITLSATENDGNSLTYSTNATFGTLTDNVFEWTPGFDDAGTYDIEFSVTDGIDTDSEIITITVVNVNSPPVFDSVSSKTIEINKNLQFSINATDTDDDSLEFSVIGILPNGSEFNVSNLLFNWTPTSNQTGTYSVNFTVTDGMDYDNLTVPISVTEVSATTASTSTTSSGGGGGGGGTTGETYENIAFKDVLSEFVSKGSATSYEFDNEQNDIEYIRFQAFRNWGKISSTIEMLHDRSALVDMDAPDIVYCNVNLWVGKSGFSSSENIEDTVVGFRVKKDWIEENEIDLDTIRLCRYSEGQWNYLDTQKISEDGTYLHFESSTPGFSPFAITGEANETKLESTLDDQYSTENDNTFDNNNSRENETQVEPTVNALSILISGLIISFACFLMRKQ
ncbi:putative Ig domain-containing protein [uncultured Methanolobus sp.]|uniref:putative Ig domain-containing protein n=1 Tax=uncultured Methanolobus sp. TaxID=218300 RepID=UPI0029C6BF20|nr:putative Ig domain-containing protein [uncultured Methanolobus sp.]